MCVNVSMCYDNNCCQKSVQLQEEVLFLNLKLRGNPNVRNASEPRKRAGPESTSGRLLRFFFPALVKTCSVDTPLH